ncbi:hypothetical protein K1719_004346 [Acacia pycnantha]|nr:hypothetical protein K1719_004346 [Acacia pycnantha]
MRTDSVLWKHLTRIWPKVLEKIHWEVGNGERVNFWYDQWLEDGSLLANQCSGYLSEEVKNNTVSGMVRVDGCWDVQRIKNWVNAEGVQKVLSVAPPNNLSCVDTMKWGMSLHGGRCC